ncbi:14081_t:CDS:2 [Rhizophagus irregularis]|nr:14081_t:CDS:2 [Rhizophagus irregularis]
MQKIFKYTIQISNKKNLFKLLLVNKYWCENVIPILWNNPFRDLFPPSILRHTPSRDPRICYNLLRTYISCLDNDEYYLLFSKLNPSLHPFDMEIPNSFKTLYNYPNYLKELSYSDLENTIYTSFMINLKNSNSKNSNFQQEKYQAFSIASALCKLFLQNSTQLKFLLFNSSSTCNDSIMDIPNIKRYNNITIKPVLSNITKFQFKDIKIRSNNILTLLNSISIYSTKINHLDFKIDSKDYNNDLIQSISNIIKSQKQLFEFNISNLKDNFSESIFLSLFSHHKSTLFSLKLQNIHFTKLSLSILPNLINLKNLYLFNCNGFNNMDITNDFRNFNLRKLQIFSENDNDVETRNLLLQLLKQSGSSLIQLGIDLVFIKNLNIKRIITTKSTTSKPSNNNNNRYLEFFGLAMDRNSSKFRFIENTYGSELFPKACELSFVRVVHGACRIMVNNERLINSEGLKKKYLL